MASPQEIAENYPTVTLEQVNVAIDYYLHNKAAVDDYIRRGEAIAARTAESVMGTILDITKQ